MKILIINLTRMGDILQTTPLVAELKKQFKSCLVSYMAAKSFSGILKHIPFIDKVIEFNFKEFTKRSIDSCNLLKLAENLNFVKSSLDLLIAEEYDLVINLTHTDESKALSYLINGKETRGITRDNKGFRIVNHPWANYFYNSSLNRNVNRINLVDIYLKIGNLNRPVPYQKIQFRIDFDDLVLAEYLSLLSEFKGYYAIQLGASVDNKQYPPEKFAKTASLIWQQYQLAPVFLGTEKELNLYEKIKHLLDFNHCNLMGKTNLNQLAGVLQKAQFLLTNDTGTMHLAAATETKIICIALATAYSHETCSYMAGNFILEADIDCSPCSHHVVCQNLVCKNYIKPAHLVKCVESILKGSDPDISMDEAELYKNIRLYKTTFDDFGFLRLFPLLKKDVTARDLMNLVYHFMWINSLGNQDYDITKLKNYYTNSQLLNAHKEAIKKELKTFYKGEVQNLERTKDFLEKLQLLTEKGLSLGSELGEFYKSGKFEELKSKAPLLQEIDEEIIKTGFSCAELRPVTYQFQFGKENLSSDDLNYLFRNTIILYQELNYRVKIIMRLI